MQLSYYQFWRIYIHSIHTDFFIYDLQLRKIELNILHE